MKPITPDVLAAIRASVEATPPRERCRPVDAQVVLRHLHDWSKHGLCDDSLAQIAAGTDLTERTVRRALVVLGGAGLIDVVRHGGARSNGHNRGTVRRLVAYGTASAQADGDVDATPAASPVDNDTTASAQTDGDNPTTASASATTASASATTASASATTASASATTASAHPPLTWDDAATRSTPVLTPVRADHARRRAHVIDAYVTMEMQIANMRGGIRDVKALAATKRATAENHPELDQLITGWPEAPDDVIAAALTGDRHSLANYRPRASLRDAPADPPPDWLTNRKAANQ